MENKIQTESEIHMETEIKPKISRFKINFDSIKNDELKHGLVRMWNRLHNKLLLLDEKSKKNIMQMIENCDMESLANYYENNNDKQVKDASISARVFIDMMFQCQKSIILI